MTSARTLWIKEPAAGVAVVIVSSTDLSGTLALRLKTALEDWDEVAYLQVFDPTALQQEWLAAENQRAGFACTCQASAVLGGLGKNCLLLDIENGRRGELAWLGSVCGHTLRFLELQAGEHLDESQCERIVAALRDLVKHQLEGRYLSC